MKQLQSILETVSGYAMLSVCCQTSELGQVTRRSVVEYLITNDYCPLSSTRG